jgi:hypothetical protein
MKISRNWITGILFVAFLNVSNTRLLAEAAISIRKLALTIQNNYILVHSTLWIHLNQSVFLQCYGAQGNRAVHSYLDSVPSKHKRRFGSFTLLSREIFNASGRTPRILAPSLSFKFKRFSLQIFLYKYKPTVTSRVRVARDLWLWTLARGGEERTDDCVFVVGSITCQPSAILPIQQVI